MKAMPIFGTWRDSSRPHHLNNTAKLRNTFQVGKFNTMAMTTLR